jgi:biotin operon repressor
MNKTNQLLTVLSRHIGRGNGISGKVLAQEMGINTRSVRKQITDAIDESDVAICGTPRDGYFIAATAEELAETLAFHRGRALHELHKMSRLSKIPLADLLGQLHLPI